MKKFGKALIVGFFFILYAPGMIALLLSEIIMMISSREYREKYKEQARRLSKDQANEKFGKKAANLSWLLYGVAATMFALKCYMYA